MAAQPDLHTVRLLLRPFTAADAGDVRRLAGEFAVADTTLNVPHPYEPGMAEDWIESHAPGWDAGELAVYAITLREGGELVGAISLQVDREYRRANLGYWIGTPYWNRGYCTEAAAAIVDFGFDTLELHRIHASHLARNPASGRVMQKLGMQQEGTLREHTRKWDRYEDLVVYGLLRDQAS